MTNKKITIDRPDISDQEILKFKNYDKVSMFNNRKGVNSNSSKSFLKSPGFFSIIGAIAIIGTALLLITNNKDNQSSLNNTLTNDVLKKSTVINPPFEEYITCYEEFIINKNSDTTLISSSGSLIYIGPNTFCDLKGNEISNDEIKIKYREFHTPYDFFINGIPMEYDSAGIDYTFQSAGMLEFLAYSGNEAIEVKDGKEIAIDMISYDNRDIYNQYYLDTQSGEWLYEGKHEINDIPFYRDEQSQMIVENECNNIYIEKIRKPILRNKAKYSFQFDIEDEAFPELSEYKDVLFEVDQEACYFTPDYYSIEWESTKITKDKNSDNYILTLKKADSTVVLLVYPVLDDNSYSEAIDRYNQHLVEIDKQKDSVLSNRNRENIHQVYNQTEFINNQLSEQFVPATRRGVIVRRTGYHNYDKPVLPPQGKNITPEFRNAENNKIEFTQIYLVEMDKNVLYTMSDKKLTINTKKDNLMWIVTDNQKIAIPEKNINESIIEHNNILFMDEYDYRIGIEMIVEKSKKQQSEKKEITVNLFPNPVKSILNIEFSELVTGLVQIMDDQGKLIKTFSFSTDKIKQNLSELKNGNYLVTIISQPIEYKKSFKVIKI